MWLPCGSGILQWPKDVNSMSIDGLPMICVTNAKHVFWILLTVGCNGSLNAAALSLSLSSSLASRHDAIVDGLQILFVPVGGQWCFRQLPIATKPILGTCTNHLSCQTSRRDVPGWPKEHFHVSKIGGFPEMYDFPIQYAKPQPNDENLWCQLHSIDLN